MNLRENLSTRYNKENTEFLFRTIASDKKLFQELMRIFLSEDGNLSQRSGWVIGHFNQQQFYSWFKPYFNSCFALLKKEIHGSYKRNILRSFSAFRFEEKYHAQLFDICIQLLNKPTEELAVKANAMAVARNISIHYPELANELYSTLILLIEIQPAPAIISRGKKIVKELQKLHSFS